MSVAWFPLAVLVGVAVWLAVRNGIADYKRAIGGESGEDQ